MAVHEAGSLSEGSALTKCEEFPSDIDKTLLQRYVIEQPVSSLPHHGSSWHQSLNIAAKKEIREALLTTDRAFSVEDWMGLLIL